MQNANASIDSLMKRGFLYLDDGDWENAKKYFNDSLDIDPENAKAYVGMLLSELHIKKENDLSTSRTSFTDNYYYNKALRFANEEYLQQLKQYNIENSYFRASELFSASSSECALISDIEAAKELFKSLNGYKNSDELVDECDTIIEQLKQKRAAVKKSRIIKIAVFSAIIVVFLTIALVGKISANNKIAEEIYQNFLEKEFKGEEEDDNGFYYDYRSNSLNPYMTYWLDTEKRTLTFNKDGSIYYTYVSDKTVLAYPSSMSEPEGSHYENDGTYSSFDVRVALNGDVYLELGTESYQVSVNDDNVPTMIFGYHGMTLD